jgi:hypothetical protein
MSKLKVTLTLEVPEQLHHPLDLEGDALETVKYLIEHYGTNIPGLGFPIQHGPGDEWELARVRDVTVEKI